MADKETKATACEGADGAPRKPPISRPRRSHSAPSHSAIGATKSVARSRSFLRSDASAQFHLEVPTKVCADNDVSRVYTSRTVLPICNCISPIWNSLSDGAMSSSGIGSMTDAPFSDSIDDLSTELDAELERYTSSGEASLSDLQSSRFQNLKQIDEDVDQYSEISRPTLSPSIPTMVCPAAIITSSHNIKPNYCSTPSSSISCDWLQNISSPCHSTPANSPFEAHFIELKGRKLIRNSFEFSNIGHRFGDVSFNEEDVIPVNFSRNVLLDDKKMEISPSYLCSKFLSTDLKNSDCTSLIPPNALPKSPYCQLPNKDPHLSREMNGCGEREINLSRKCISTEMSDCDSKGKFTPWPSGMENDSSVTDTSTLGRDGDSSANIPLISLPNDIKWNPINDAKDDSSDVSDVGEQSVQNSCSERCFDINRGPEFHLEDTNVIGQHSSNANKHYSTNWYPGLRFYIKKPYKNSSS